MTLSELSEQVRGLKTLPTTFYQVNDLIRKHTSTAGDIGEVISRDQVLSIKLLRLVNSAFYAFPTKIDNITRAVTIIGFNGVRDLILTTSVTDVFLKGSGGGRFNRLEFWKHSLGCGIAAKVIGKYVRKVALEELFVAGLLHDIGKVVIDQYMPDKFAKIVLLTEQHPILMNVVEKKILGYDHCDVGKMIGQKWELSKSVIEAITYHHKSEDAPEFPVHAAITHIANTVVQAINIGYSGNRYVPLIEQRPWKLLELQITMLEPIIEETINQFADLEKVFSMVDK